MILVLLTPHGIIASQACYKLMPDYFIHNEPELRCQMGRIFVVKYGAISCRVTSHYATYQLEALTLSILAIICSIEPCNLIGKSISALPCAIATPIAYNII